MQRLVTARAIRDLDQAPLSHSFGSDLVDLPRRVVVTGLGLVTPLGRGVEETWSRLVEGRSGLRKLSATDLPPVKGCPQKHVPCSSAGSRPVERCCVLKEHNPVFEQLPCKVAACVPEAADGGEPQRWKPALSGLLGARHILFGLEVIFWSMQASISDLMTKFA